MPTTQTMNEDGSTDYRLITGRKFTISKHPDVDPADVPGSSVALALEALNALADKTHSVWTDPTLTEVGRHRALDEMQRETIKKIARMHSFLVSFETSLNARERQHLAIPELPPNQLAETLQDMEIRTWWLRASTDDRTATLQRAGTDPQYRRVLIALLRSPIPVGSDPELRAAHQGWANLQDAAAPEVREQIEGQRRALDWGMQNLALIASIVYDLVLTYGGRDKREVLQLLLEDNDERVQKGHFIFGYTVSEVAHVRRVLDTRRVITP